MKKYLLLAATCCCLSSAGFAAEQKATGFYIGGSAGVTELDDDGAFNGLDFDDTDSAFALFGGYKILKYLAVEARYTDFGDYSVSNGSMSESVDLSSISGHVEGIIPFSTSGWELFGQLGFGRMSIDCDGCSDETVGSAGIGVRFYPTANLAISLQTDAYAWEEDDSFDTYDFAVVATQFGIQYIF